MTAATRFIASVTTVVPRWYVDMMIGPDPISQLLAARDATATATQPTFPAQRTIGAAMPPHAQPMTGPLGALMSAGESVHNGIIARRQAGLKPEDYITLATLVTPALGRIAKLGAGPLNRAAAALSMAPAEAAPVERLPTALDRALAAHSEWAGARTATADMAPAAARAIPGAEMQTLDASSLTNLLNSGFANMAVTPESVVLPSAGAGRAGTTTAAVAKAKKLIGDDELRRLAKIEQAKRGGTSAESAMASMEQVARDVASKGKTPTKSAMRVLADSATASAAAQPFRAAQRRALQTGQPRQSFYDFAETHGLTPAQALDILNAHLKP